jgi:hypothetical protein
MTDTATHITDRLRKEVEHASKDKIRGSVVKHFRKLFPATEMERWKGYQYASTASAGSSNKKIRHKVAQKGRKRVLAPTATRRSK